MDGLDIKCQGADMESVPTGYKYNRRSIRLPYYDYSRAGFYFITICTHGHLHLFGEIVDDVMMMREVEGGHAVLDTRRLQEETGAISIEEVNVLEEKLSLITAPLLIEHYETRFIRLTFNP